PRLLPPLALGRTPPPGRAPRRRRGRHQPARPRRARGPRRRRHRPARGHRRRHHRAAPRPRRHRGGRHRLRAHRPGPRRGGRRPRRGHPVARRPDLRGHRGVPPAACGRLRPDHHCTRPGRAVDRGRRHRGRRPALLYRGRPAPHRPRRHRHRDPARAHRPGREPARPRARPRSPAAVPSGRDRALQRRARGDPDRARSRAHRPRARDLARRGRGRPARRRRDRGGADRRARDRRALQPQRRDLGPRGRHRDLAPVGRGARAVGRTATPVGDACRPHDHHRIPRRRPGRSRRGDTLMTLRTDHLEADVLRTADGSTLQVRAADDARLAPFEGEARPDGDGHLLTGPLSPANAAALREAFPVLRPRPIGDTRTSVGTGDRLGLATAGQARAFRDQDAGLAPVLAQQSIREMDRLGRDALSVIDEATFGCLEEGWDGGYGADCDHIKTTEGIDRGLAAGFVTFTLDPGDHVVDVTGGITEGQLAEVPWETLGDDLESLRARYVRTVLDLGGSRIEITREAIDTAAVKYGPAVAEAARLFRHLQGSARHEVEAEIAVDETAWLTTFVEHHYMAGELTRLGVEWFSFAPRYVDGFEKGVEFLGDEDELRENLTAHHTISRLHGGYKISLHSGSDKFSIYPLAV